MTKYDIRLRRKSLTSGQIERYKDFKGLYKMDQVEKKSSVYKIISIVTGVVAIVVMIGLGLVKLNTEKVTEPIDQSTPDIFDEFKSE